MSSPLYRPTARKGKHVVPACKRRGRTFILTPRERRDILSGNHEDGRYLLSDFQRPLVVVRVLSGSLILSF